MKHGVYIERIIINLVSLILKYIDAVSVGLNLIQATYLSFF